MNKISDINKEYESIIPPVKRKTLFDDNVTYEIFRSKIIHEDVDLRSKRALPFSGVRFVDYVDMMRFESIEKAIAQRRYVYFIKCSKKGRKDYCDATGYYKKYTKKFVLLPYSYIVDIESSKVKLPFADSIDKCQQSGHYYVSSPIFFDNPADAATFVLGKTTGAERWVDRKGKSLLVFFPDLQDRCSKVKQGGCINNEREEIKLKLAEIVASLQNMLYAKKEVIVISEKSANVDEPKQQEIQVGDLCHVHLVNNKDSSIKAYGYYDFSNRMFVLKEGNTWSIDVTSKFRFTATEIRRRLYIRKYCKIVSGNLIQSVDVICKNPDIAACFVLGDIANGWHEWIDENGVTLREIIKKRI